jgi:hypothetical protein
MTVRAAGHRRNNCTTTLVLLFYCSKLVIVTSLAVGKKGTNRWLSSSSSSTPSTPDSYIRLRRRNGRGNNAPPHQVMELETAVTTLERKRKDHGIQTIELHAQIHFGSQDYLDYYNSQEFTSRFDRVYYELLVDDELMITASDNSQERVLAKDVPLMASPSDRTTAYQYGLKCQVDVIDYAKPNWIHADLTRQEFGNLLQASNPPKKNPNQPQNQPTQPLWALASTAATWPGAEALSAMIRPVTPSTPVALRLFSNLFLPGSALATVLRLLFWILVPAPELSVMLLDWSSILPRPTGGGVSQVAVPVLELLVTGQIQQARQLVFGQVLVSGQTSYNTNNNNHQLLISARNDHALQILQQSLDREDCDTIALLYGAMHCPDLYQKLLRQGFVPASTKTWRTAWSVRIPKFGTVTPQTRQFNNNDNQDSSSSRSRWRNNNDSSSSSTTTASTARLSKSFPFGSVSPNALAVGLVVVPFYLVGGGFDWIGTLQDTELSMRSGNYLSATLGELLYLIRHIALYLSLAKFVVQWDVGNNISNDEGIGEENSLFEA